MALPDQHDDSTSEASAMRDRSSSSGSGCPVDQLGWFANQTLSPEERTAVAAHLTGCAICRAEVAAWSELRLALRGVSAQTPAPQADLFSQVARQLDTLPPPPPRRSPAASAAPLPVWPRPHRLLRAGPGGLGALRVGGEHFRAQARLIRRDLFWMPLLLLPLAGWIIYMSPSGPQAPGAVPETAALLAALLTALGMAFLYGQEVDPAREMVLVTPTSPRLVLGVRCCLVFGYDLLLNYGVVLPLLAGPGIVTPGWFLTNWLAPLCCLSAIALLLSIAFNSGTAVVVCILLWAVRLLDNMPILGEVPWQSYYEGFWRQGAVLFVVALLAVLLTFGLLERKEHFA